MAKNSVFTVVKPLFSLFPKKSRFFVFFSPENSSFSLFPKTNFWEEGIIVIYKCYFNDFINIFIIFKIERGETCIFKKKIKKKNKIKIKIKNNFNFFFVKNIKI